MDRTRQGRCWCLLRCRNEQMNRLESGRIYKVVVREEFVDKKKKDV